jgi:pimeloyl-ACP methyl ester carboxylesterase
MASKPSFIEHRVPREQGSGYARDYKGTDPAFVLTHGFPDNLKIYDDLVPYLVASGRRVVAFDFLGYGASDKPAGASYGFKQQLGDLEAIVEALHLEKIVPVGHDAGGPAAINFAIDHPDRVASLCVLNTFYAATPTLRLPELIELFATPSLKALATAMAQSPEQLAWLLQFQQKIFKDALSEDQSAYFATFLGPIINDTFMKQPSAGPAFVQMTSHILEEVTRNTKRIPEMEALDMPIKLIWGGNDPYLSTDVAKDFQSHLKHSSLHVIPAGHWLQVDAPAQVAKEMLS